MNPKQYARHKQTKTNDGSKSPLDLVLSKLPDATKCGNGWQACCPAHEDRKPSLSISKGKAGKVLLNCKAGCSLQGICDALQLRVDELFSKSSERPTVYAKRRKPANVSMDGVDKPNGRTFPTAADAIGELERRHGKKSTRWMYQDSEGASVGVVVRWDLGDGKKDIRPIALIDGSWQICGMPEPRPLYRLPELNKATTVYVCEGEKAADAVRKLGLTATTAAHGSQSPHKTDWTPLIGKQVVILPDNDDSGTKYATKVAELLLSQSANVSVKIVSLPGLPPKGDAVEFVKARRKRSTREIKSELERLANSAERCHVDDYLDEDRITPEILRMSDVTPEEVRWLWYPRIALGKLTIIAGDPGLGKSFLSCDLAARVSRGSTWPDDPSDCAPRGSVILLNCEDGVADTIQPRLKKHQADLSRIVTVTAVRDASDKNRKRPFDLSRDVRALEKAVRDLGDCRLIVVDPISAYLGSDVNSHSNTEVRAILTPLVELASRHSVAVVGISHLNKGVGAAMYRTMGSIAFNATARAVWYVARDRQNSERRLFVPVKNNLGNDVSGLAYKIDDGKVLWERNSIAITADEALALEPQCRGPKPEQRNEASGFLQAALAKGPRLVKNVQRDAESCGIKEHTLKRAKQESDVRSFRKKPSGPWWWELPTSSRAILKQPGPLGPLDSPKTKPNSRPSQKAKGTKRPVRGPKDGRKLPK